MAHDHELKIRIYCYQEKSETRVDGEDYQYTIECWTELSQYRAIELLAERLIATSDKYDVSAFLNGQSKVPEKIPTHITQNLEAKAKNQKKLSDLEKWVTEIDSLYEVVKKSASDRSPRWERLKRVKGQFDETLKSRVIDIFAERLMPTSDKDAVSILLNDQTKASEKILTDIARRLEEWAKAEQESLGLKSWVAEVNSLYELVKRFVSVTDLRSKLLQLFTEEFDKAVNSVNLTGGEILGFLGDEIAYELLIQNGNGSDKDQANKAEKDFSNKGNEAESKKTQSPSGISSALETSANNVNFGRTPQDVYSREQLVAIRVYKNQKTQFRIARMGPAYDRLAAQYPWSEQITLSGGLAVQNYDLALIGRALILAKAAQARLLLNEHLSQHHLIQERAKKIRGESENGKALTDESFELWEDIEHEH